MPPDRQLVLDEQLPKSLVRELIGRGYGATSVEDLGWKGVSDEELIRRVSELRPMAILVTHDKNMVTQHRTALLDRGVTLAVVDPPLPQGAAMNDGQLCRDVVHRHAHAIISQEEGSWFRYTQQMKRRIDS